MSASRFDGKGNLPKVLNLKVVNKYDNEIYFKIKDNTSLQKLMNAYCNHCGISPHSVHFTFNENILLGNETAFSLNMHDKDIILVHDNNIDNNDNSLIESNIENSNDNSNNNNNNNNNSSSINTLQKDEFTKNEIIFITHLMVYKEEMLLNMEKEDYFNEKMNIIVNEYINKCFYKNNNNTIKIVTELIEAIKNCKTLNELLELKKNFISFSN
ncbi:hypothetical protein ABK040_000030 [Willaertia magna]